MIQKSFFYTILTVACFIAAASIINAQSSSGCSDGYYWDSYTNSCQMMQSGSGTSSQCGSGYYWNSSTNSCQASSGCGSYTTTAICTATSGCAWNSAGNYCYSASTSNTGFTGSGSTSSSIPSAPSGLAAILVPGTTDINLSWTDIAPNTETFKVYRRKSGTTSWELLATQAYSLRTYTDLSLAFGSYEYYVVACSSAGCSGQSNWAYVSVSSSSKTITGSVTYADGTPVTDAKVNAWNKNTNEGKEAATASNGSYTLAVSGGTWELYVYPTSASATWSYNQSPKTVLFANNETSEQTTVAFTVVRTDTTVKGIIVKPDGSAPPVGSVQVNLKNSEESWFGAQVASDGSFIARVIAGTYNIFINVQDSLLTAPSIASFSASSGEVKDVGTITLIQATKTITGSVTYADGTPVVDASVNAWQQSTGKNARADTNSSGVYTFSVSGGVWEVSVYPSSISAKWNYSQPPLSVSFALGTTSETATHNFTVTKTDAEVRGKIVRPDGSAPPPNTMSVDFHPSSGWGFGGSVDANGQFRVAVPAGIYTVSVWSNDKTFAVPQLPSVTIAVGETKDLGTITLVEAVKTITGTVTYPDGRPVTDASVGAFNKSSQQWLDTPTNSSGGYLLKVLGGMWEVSVHPLSATTQWNQNQEPKSITFKNDASTETASLHFVVVATDAVITGKILLPDGTPPPSDAVYVNAETAEGQRFGGQVDSKGMFQLSVVADTYKLFIWGKDPVFTAPPLSSVTVAKGGKTDIGTVYFIKKIDHIKGLVRDANGNAINNVEVNAWMPIGSGYTSAKTDAAGSFDLLVTPGTWEVHVYADLSTNYYDTDPPKQVSVSTGVPTTVNFTLRVADAGISGTVIDATGAVLSNLYGFVNLSQSQEHQGGGGLGGPLERGTFSFKAPAGTYSLFVFFPPESSYTAGAAQSVTLRSGETTSVKVTATKNTAKIGGTLKDEKGTNVTGVSARVFATSGKGAWQETRVDSQTGRYALTVGAGTWYLGYDIDATSGYLSHQEPNMEVVVSEGSVVTKDLLVKKASSLITGRVADPGGTGVFNVFVGVSKASFVGATESGEFKDLFVTGAQTDANGQYRIAIPAGSYFIKTFVAPERGFINSKEAAFTISDKETKTIDLQLRKADVTITGFVLRDTVPVPGMFVWGWSDQGGYQESISGPEGAFRLNVTGSDTWMIAAGGEINGIHYKSSEIKVGVEKENITRDIPVTKYASLPEAIVQTSDATKPTLVEVKDGATVIVPANAVSSSGSVSMSVTPDTRTPSQGEVKVVGIAYDLAARDATGQKISTFKADVTITIPYKEEDLAALGMREDDLVMSFWDETAGTWKTIESSLVNKQENTVTASVNHFTRFAIVAAADISPPVAPTNVVASARATGGIGLTWINPVSDFHHAKVYRSRFADALGTSQTTEVFTNAFTDTQDLIAGTTYYYTVRAVDAAGNESENSDSTAITATVSSVAGETSPIIATLPPGQIGGQRIGRNLTIGSTGDDVMLLQQLLLAEGVYSEGLITGYFGSLTRKAVIRFQEKYRAEILLPAGLQAGTGFVGPSTRAKMNVLLGAPTGLSLSAEESTTGDSFERNLALGTTGTDVRLLQGLLRHEDVYPEGLITGYFGSLTRKAVIRFQEKYRAEILLPAGLQAGTGFVGPSTRAKMNVLVSRPFR